ncbi:MAG: TIGR04283 family arsenosugar biosynthesis glycosyltransferase [Planctomycetota bacterium]|jgi:rSAM/selenodomain-associated transferase 2/rSAM/selenodomain-associated transferase 1
MKERVILFTRLPLSGSTKTRMIPALGEEGAADLQRAMTEHALQTLRDLQMVREIELEVRLAGDDLPAAQDWLGDDLLVRSQHGDNLGSRMHNAFQEAFAEGAERVLVVGADIPGITPSILTTALRALHTRDLVLGPASDGGYYLIGLDRPRESLFCDMRWGEESVFAETLDRAARLNLALCRLPELDDVDRPEDLPVWEAARGAEREESAPAISVIIPALDEAQRVAAAVHSVIGHGNECIVVDGGSGDDTRKRASQVGATVIESPPGRGRQMNHGAELAGGEILIFLHADTLLPENFAEAVKTCCADSGCAGGAFRLQFDESSARASMVAAWANLRSRFLLLPFGDQALFCRREIFQTIGGFPAWPSLEDLELVCRLRRQGGLILLPVAVTSSFRRWREQGFWRTAGRHLCMQFAYWLGLNREE